MNISFSNYSYTSRRQTESQQKQSKRPIGIYEEEEEEKKKKKNEESVVYIGQ